MSCEAVLLLPWNLSSMFIISWHPQFPHAPWGWSSHLHIWLKIYGTCRWLDFRTGFQDWHQFWWETTPGLQVGCVIHPLKKDACNRMNNLTRHLCQLNQDYPMNPRKIHCHLGVGVWVRYDWTPSTVFFLGGEVCTWNFHLGFTGSNSWEGWKTFGMKPGSLFWGFMIQCLLKYIWYIYMFSKWVGWNHQL